MIPAAFDHLIVGTPGLDSAIADIERRLGVRPRIGGRHPTLGTRNALVDLETGYLEVIAPDPDNTRPVMPFGLESLDDTRVVGWAVSVGDLDAALAELGRVGFDFGHALDLSRTTPDGRTLTWRSTWMRPDDSIAYPILIEWGAGVSTRDQSRPAGCRLSAFRLRHPRRDDVDRALSALDAVADIAVGSDSGIDAVISGPAGTWTVSDR